MSRHFKPLTPLSLALTVAGFAALGLLSESVAGRPNGALAANDFSTNTISAMAPVIQRFAGDRSALGRRYDSPGSVQARQRWQKFYDEWSQVLDSYDFDQLGLEEKIDWVLLANEIRSARADLDLRARLDGEVQVLTPFAETIRGLQDSRRDRQQANPESAAADLVGISESIEQLQKSLEKGLAEKAKRKQAEQAAESAEGEEKPKKRSQKAPEDKTTKQAADKNSEADSKGKEEEEIEPLETSPVLAHRAVKVTAQLRSTLERWHQYHAGYDPIFTWWTKDPHDRAQEALEGYEKFLESKVLERKEGEDAEIIGDPVGREALLDQLRAEMIAYTPEELIAIAEQDLSWCEEEMRKASRELGFGDQWKAALEHTKKQHVDPGKQPELVRDLAYEAIDFLEQRDLLTIPELAKEVWRIEMMSPERQKVNPFFLGGEVIRVSFPTDTMTHEQKMMSMRGNNRHFARATVHHELIPGHHLQGFMTSRYNQHRRIFSTPFWGEGWALYWELMLWDLDFPQSPEDRIGMLFWRMHRGARVLFSLGFHLGNMTPDEAVSLLVDRIGHEKENALGEVRRSFEANYSPLYQLAYLMGGIQIRALQRELVGSGQMTNREFHDQILRGGRMPIEMVRARLMREAPAKDFEASWRFEHRPSDRSILEQ